MTQSRNSIFRRRPSGGSTPVPGTVEDRALTEEEALLQSYKDPHGLTEMAGRPDVPLETRLDAILDPSERSGDPLVLENPTAPPAMPAPDPSAPPRKIWDVAKDVAAADPVDVAPAAAPTPATAKSPASKAPGARVKTRLLGFHSQDLDVDMFAGTPASAKAAAHTTFPIGWVAVTDGPGCGAWFVLGQGLSSIGRSADQSVALDFGDTSISRENHASIAYDDDTHKVFVGHGGKSNVVRLNGQPLLSTEELSHGDEIRIGKTTLRFIALCGPEFQWSPDLLKGEGDAGDD